MDNTIIVSFVIPVYNEARCLGRNVSRLEAYIRTIDRPYELILVDDGSLDDSAGISREIARRNPNVRFVAGAINRGKGHAVRTGMLLARGRYRIFMDADLAVPVEYVGEVIHRLEQGAEVVIGSRHLPESCIKVHEEKLRRTLGSIYRRLVLTAFDLKVSDITCGLKGFGMAATEAVFIRSRVERWGYDAEILFLAQKLGFSIREIPVTWYHSFDSDVRVFKDSVRTFVEMIQICRRFIAGGYRLPRH